MSLRRALYATVGLLLLVGPAPAADSTVEGLRRALGRLQAAPAGATAAASTESSALLGGGEGDGRAELRGLLPELERRHQARMAGFAAASARPLPAKARERLERARAAYEGGQGRLLAIVRRLASARSDARALARPRAPSIENDTLESLEILNRLEEAGLREPWSASELKLKAPALQAPAFEPPVGAAAAGTVAPENAPPVGNIDPAIKAQADALSDPIDVFEWARNTIRPEFYHGVMKGPLETLREGGGNDADTAGLLIALLRAKGIPARFVRGTVELPARLAQSLAGTASTDQAVRVFARAGIPHEPVSGPTGVTAIKIDRVWAEAYLPYINYRGAPVDATGKFWIPLDAAFKPLLDPRGLDLAQNLGFDARAAFDEYLSAPQVKTPLAFLKDRVTVLLAERSPGTPLSAVPNDRSRIVETLGLLPSTLPYKVLSVADYGFAPPEALRHAVRFTAEAEGVPILDVTFPAQDLIGKQLTLGYVPFSEEDEATARLFGGLLATPPYLVEVKALLKISGVAVAAADAPVGLGVRYPFRLEIKAPGGSETITNRLIAGNLTAIGLGGSSVPSRALQDDEAARILSGLALQYLRNWSLSDDELADLFHVAPLRPTLSVCFVLSDIEVEYAGGDPLYPVSFEWKGIAVDADLRASAPVGISHRENERDFTLWSGLEGSILENRLFEDQLQIPSVSTAKVLQLAPGQGTPVLSIDRGNVDTTLPGLPFDAEVKAEIRDGVGRGLLVRVPADFVTSMAWTGVGYLLLDEETGEAAWQLQGGHSGGVTAPSVFELPEELVDVLTKASDSPQFEPGKVATVQKYGSGDFQFGTVDKDLDKAFRVLVTDAGGFPVPQMPVTFQVIGGEGQLRDASGISTGSAITVLSCGVADPAPYCAGLKPGEAVAHLKLGKDTRLIPRFFCEEGRNCDCPTGNCNPDFVDYATQVGVNLVTVYSGNVQLPEPFTAFGKPDDQFDGTFRRVFLSFGTAPESGWWNNLTVADRAAIRVNDMHGNPISNAGIQFAYRPAPIVGTPPPGYSVVRAATTTPGHVLKPFDYEKCIETTPAVIYGQCSGEAEQVVVKSSTFGSSAYPLLGDSPFSLYYYDIGTTIEPKALWALWGTTGVICPAPSPESCGHRGRRPWVDVSHGTRPYLVNTAGNLIEAYALGGRATFGAFAAVIEEGYSIETFRYNPDDGEDHYRVRGNNVWKRKHLDDSRFLLSALTPGTGVPGSASSRGNGLYEASMTIGTSPQLNTVQFSGVHTPEDFRYRKPSEAEVFPADVTLPDQVRKYKESPRSGEGKFSLWGIEPVVTGVNPTPVLVSGAGVVTRASGVAHDVRPSAYRQLLETTGVQFDMKNAAGEPVLTAFGADGTDYQIPVGLPLAPGVYAGQLTVRGVSSVATRADVVSEPFPIPVCSLLDLATPVVMVGLTIDPLNARTCPNDGTMVFAVCRGAKVTITLDGEVLNASLDGQDETDLKDVVVSGGVHTVTLPATEFGLLMDKRTPFRVESVDLVDPSLVSAADGVVVNSLVNRSVLPVGHTFAKGVDLLDGHMVQQSVDFKVPGRHLGLEVTRTYSSAGKSEEGVVGAGWDLNYASRVTPAECGVVTVTTADGSSQVFQPDGTGYKPQKGYHSKLVKNTDGSFDFTDKSGTVHHFREPDDPRRATGVRRLDYVLEPHGDKLVLTYDLEGRVSRVAEVHQDGGEQRAVQFTYRRLLNGFDRLASAEIKALRLKVDYQYDEWGNLLQATRSGDNVNGAAAEPRVERYEYSSTNALDRHQMLAAIDANGNRREYRYYAKDDPFPGEGPAFFVLGKEEFVKEVVELARPGSLTTRFQYDYTDVPTKRNWKTTVRDARGNDTLYVLNGNGSPLRVVEPLAKSSETEWAADDIFKLSEKDALGRVTRLRHDDRANLIREEILAPVIGSVVTEYEYEASFNKMTRKVDANLHETRWTIDTDTGDVLEMRDAENNLTKYVYDSQGRLTATFDARNNRTEYRDHDSFGHPRRVEDPEGNVTELEYDLRGRLIRQTDSFGRDTRQEFDGLDRLTRLLRVAGSGSDDEETVTTYFPNGEPRTLKNANDATTTFTLDGLNRVTSTVTQFDGQVLRTATVYDGNGNKERETDRRGVTRKNTFDALNRLVKVEIVSGVAGEGPTGEVASFGYDKLGNKTSETNVAKLTTTFVYDGLYRVKEMILPEGPGAGNYRELYDYDKVGNRTSFTDANNHPTTYGYDKIDRLTRTTNALNQVLRVEYNDPEGSHLNKSAEIDVVRGLRTAFRYDKINRPERKEVHLEGAPGPAQTYVTSTTYEDASHSMTVTDPRGFATRSRLDGLDRVTEKTVDPGDLGLTTVTRYDGLGNPKEVVDPRGNSSLFRHDGLGRLVETKDARGGIATFAYDGEGLKTSEIDRRGVRRDFTFDNLGRRRGAVLTPVAAMSGVPWSTEIEYQDVARRRIETDARGNKTTFQLDRLGRVTQETDPNGKFRNFGYDGVNKIEETDKRHHRTLFAYDELNRLRLVTDPPPFTDQTVETFYDDPLNRRREKDRRGFVKVTQMDPLGRVLSVTDAGITLETNSYDGNGNKETATDADGHVTRFVYDAANRLSSRTDGFGSPDAATTSFQYDKNGNQEIERDQRAADLGDPFSIKRTFDKLNRLETQTNGEDETTTYDHDPEGNRTLVKEPKGFETRFAHDELGKLTRVTQPSVPSGMPVTRYVYDPNRNRITQIDANNHAVSMVYDKLNRLERMEQPGSLVTLHGYDEDGNETSLTDPNGQLVTTTYDELSRQHTKSYALAAGAPEPWRRTTGLVYAYDENSNLKQADETVASRGPPASSEVLVTSRTYDGLDRLETETTTLPDVPVAGPRTRTVTWEYFGSGVRKAVIDPEGRRTQYGYDGQNRLKTATTDVGAPEQAVTSYSYWPDDLLRDVAYANGVTASHTYDKADRLLTLQNQRGPTLVSSYEYDYDPNGNRLSQIETNGLPAPVAETTTYTYDDLNRLETVTYPDKKVAYGYDNVGNRHRETERSLTDVILSDKQGQFDDNNRLESLTDLSRPGDPEAVTLFTYDRNGNQLTKKVGTAAPSEYRYDVRDKMVEVAEGASILGRYQYCYDGRRSRKIGEEGIRQYIHDQTSLLVEYDETGARKAKYDYGDRLISLFRQDEGKRYFHLDGLRSVVNLTDELGAPRASYHLDAWGNFRSPAELDASRNRFAFTGHYYDRETDLYFAKARYLDPEFGRFLSQDSYLGEVDDPPSLHRYSYVHNSPTRYLDPTGHGLASMGFKFVKILVKGGDLLDVFADLKTDYEAMGRADTFMQRLGIGLSMGSNILPVSAHDVLGIIDMAVAAKNEGAAGVVKVAASQTSAGRVVTGAESLVESGTSLVENVSEGNFADAAVDLTDVAQAASSMASKRGGGKKSHKDADKGDVRKENNHANDANPKSEKIDTDAKPAGGSGKQQSGETQSQSQGSAPAAKKPTAAPDPEPPVPGKTDAPGKTDVTPPPGEGVVYKRTDPKTGEPYVGKTKSPERYDARQGEHDKKLGVEHEYEILGRAKPGKDLDVLEETTIREHGGLQKEGGTLANKRHEMREKRYREGGGTTDDPNR